MTTPSGGYGWVHWLLLTELSGGCGLGHRLEIVATSCRQASAQTGEPTAPAVRIWPWQPLRPQSSPLQTRNQFSKPAIPVGKDTTLDNGQNRSGERTATGVYLLTTITAIREDSWARWGRGLAGGGGGGSEEKESSQLAQRGEQTCNTPSSWGGAMGLSLPTVRSDVIRVKGQTRQQL